MDIKQFDLAQTGIGTMLMQKQIKCWVSSKDQQEQSRTL
jgi:hypothetical protein